MDKQIISLTNNFLSLSNVNYVILFYPVQPSDYINALLVPRDGHITIDAENLAAQEIFEVVWFSSFGS